MVKCPDCKKEMLKASSCTFPYLRVGDKMYERNTTYFDTGKRCHDCGIINKRGNIHHVGCDMERCPICGKQLISCGHLEHGYTARQDSSKFPYYLPTWKVPRWK